MLGKLLKHEFRATGRIMLPIYAAMVVLTVLANLSIRFMDQTNIGILRLLFILILVAFVAGIVAATVITLVIMILRFYRSLLRERGYLMHTLPVTVHGHIWSKLIVSVVWFAVTALLIWLAVGLTAFIQSGTDLGELLAQFPTWAELRDALLREGITTGDLTLVGAEVIVGALLGCLSSCLHFYGAMTIGHMFAKSKVLLSVVFYIAISIVFSTLGTGVTAAIARDSIQAETSVEVITFLQANMGRMLLVELFEAALLYAATALGLKRGLNLA